MVRIIVHWCSLMSHVHSIFSMANNICHETAIPAHCSIKRENRNNFAECQTWLVCPLLPDYSPLFLFTAPRFGFVYLQYMAQPTIWDVQCCNRWQAQKTISFRGARSYSCQANHHQRIAPALRLDWSTPTGRDSILSGCLGFLGAETTWEFQLWLLLPFARVPHFIIWVMKISPVIPPYIAPSLKKAPALGEIATETDIKTVRPVRFCELRQIRWRCLAVAASCTHVFGRRGHHI